MLLFYSALFLLVLFLAYWLFSSFMQQTLSKEIAVSNKRLLTQIQVSADSRLSALQSFILEQLTNLYRNTSITQFFAGTPASDTRGLLNAYNSLEEPMRNHAFVDSIYVYRNADDMLISSREGIVFGASNPSQRFILFEPIKRIMASDSNELWLSPAENAGANAPPEPIVSLAYSVPLFMPANAKSGAVVININEEKFIHTINNDVNMDYGMLIVDGSGETVASNERERLSADNGRFPGIEAVLRADEGYATVGMDGRMYGISWVKSPKNGWKYVSYAPLETLNRQLDLARRTAIVIAALTVLVALAGLAVITSKINQPLRKFIQSATSRFNIQYENMNEVTFFDRIITNLSSRVEEMDATLRQNQPLIRHKLIHDLLEGRQLPSLREMNDKLDMIGEPFRFDRYAVLLAEIDPERFMRLAPEQREFILFKMIDTIDSAFDGTGCSCRSISVGQHGVATIVNYTERQPVQDDMQALLRTCNEQLGIPCSFALSAATTHMGELSALYRQAGACHKYSFIHGYGRLYTHETARELDGSKTQLDGKLLADLAPLLRACKKSQLLKQLSLIFDELARLPLSYRYVQNTIGDLLSLLDKCAKEHQIRDPELDKHQLFARFGDMASLALCRDWFGELIERYADRVGERSDAIDEQFAARIVPYIVDNIDKDISLNSVAEHFHVSPGYFSKLFRDTTGVNFSVFITEQKLLKAGDLLLHDKKRKVTEVANALGYYNHSYFSSIFKEKFGVTPAQYRKER